jgi:hypothetical protein
MRDTLEKLARALGMLSCQEMSEILTDELEGTLPSTEGRRARIHLTLCAHCRCLRRQEKLLRETLSQLPAEPPSPALKSGLLVMFRSRERGQRGP